MTKYKLTTAEQFWMAKAIREYVEAHRNELSQMASIEIRLMLEDLAGRFEREVRKCLEGMEDK